MAITGPIYWNGTTFPSQSGDPVAITQTEFEDCCCGPCDCPGEFAITVTSNCGSGDCYVGTGWEFDVFSEDTAACVWRAVDTTGDSVARSLNIFYYKGTDEWIVSLPIFGDGSPC